MFPLVEGGSSTPALVRGVELELAHLGYVMSEALRRRFGQLGDAALQTHVEWLVGALAALRGSNVKHVPLFRSFPDDIPEDTSELWWAKVLVHFLGEVEQPCPLCGRTGTTHVLSPCRHVVCEACFDGRSYSACPICQRRVDDSPFFQPSKPRPSARERVRFSLLDLGEDLDAEARALFESLCARKQALSPDDRAALQSVLADYARHVPGWIPAAIPVKEVAAQVFGGLLRDDPSPTGLAPALPFLKTATDVLRLIAAYSGADPALQAQPVLKGKPPRNVSVHRFPVAPLRRSLRRALLSVLEGFDPGLLVEDMLRHRSFWVWVGQFLHPHEYAERFPHVARAFAIVRTKAPDGTPAPPFQTYYARLERATATGSATELLSLLEQRPGEMGRRIDLLLRTAKDDPRATEAILRSVFDRLETISTPILLSLAAMLPTRSTPAPVRMYWPKGGQAKGVSSPDTRAPLDAEVAQRATTAIEAELLRRFETHDHYDTVLLDRALSDVVVPFNERTASASAVQLSRGSRIALPEGPVLRLFLHWCEPEKHGHETDLDLSVAFYDADWNYVGVCSYYELDFRHGTAKSAGDLQDAPFPDGASEFVDIHLARAREASIRYAVMVVNAYAGMPFSALERAFAGVMSRDDVGGEHFDPRTVRLRFELAGNHGIFMPMAVDLETNTLHWLDTYSKGQMHFNNVENSNAAIQRICRDMITYFATGVRMSMYQLGLLHAACRGKRVVLRSADGAAVFEREHGESSAAFLERLRHEDSAPGPIPALPPSTLALLHAGNLSLPEQAVAYALFREQLTPSLSASDFIA